MLKKGFFITVLILFIAVSSNYADKKIPLGFNILGTKVPASAENIPIPDGFIEKLPQTNLDFPELSKKEKDKGYVVFIKNYLDPV